MPPTAACCLAANEELVDTTEPIDKNRFSVIAGFNLSSSAIGSTIFSIRETLRLVYHHPGAFMLMALY